MRTQAKTAWSLTILALIFAAVLLLGPLHAPVMGQEPPPGYEQVCLADGTCIFVRIVDRIRGLAPRIRSRPLVPVGPPNPAVLQISNQTQPGGSWWGSAVAVKWQGQQVVLSVAHLLREGMGKVTVHTIDGRQAPAALIAVDNVYDLSAWRCDLQTDAVTIAVVAPVYGDLITQIGFGGGSYHANVGTVVGYGMTAGSPEHRTLKITGQARVGDSGGPMLNTAGELVAIQASIDGVVSRGTYCGQIVRFLNEHIALRPASHDAAVETPDPLLAPSVPTVPAGPAVEEKPLVAVTPQPVDQPITPAEGSSASDEGVSNPSHASLGTLPGAWGTLLTPAMTTLLIALGVSSPLAAAGGAIAVRVIPALWRRRRERKRRKAEAAGTFQPPAEQATPVNPIGIIPRDTTEAEQLLQLSELEGRSAILDALAGRVAFDELDKTIHANPSGPKADWARDFRRFLLDKCHEIIPPAVTVNQTQRT